MRCRRCQGCIFHDDDALGCMNCGWRLFKDLAEPLPASQPAPPGRCRCCRKNQILKNRHLCSMCLGARIKEGAAVGRRKA